MEQVYWQCLSSRYPQSKGLGVVAPQMVPRGTARYLLKAASLIRMTKRTGILTKQLRTKPRNRSLILSMRTPRQSFCHRQRTRKLTVNRNSTVKNLHPSNLLKDHFRPTWTKAYNEWKRNKSNRSKKTPSSRKGFTCLTLYKTLVNKSHHTICLRRPTCKIAVICF